MTDAAPSSQRPHDRQTTAGATTALRLHVDGIGIVAPGMSGWAEAAARLRGDAPAREAKTVLPPADALPAAERRRAGLAVKAALAVGREAVAAAGQPATGLASVFTSSGGDGINCHLICQALASSDRLISPTRFHNSVHNAPSGYWSISTGAMATSSVLCAYDGSFAAGLLEAATQAAVESRPVLLVAYDTDYPEPLRGKRPIPDTMGLALVLSPVRSASSLAMIEIDSRAAIAPLAPDAMPDAALEALRLAIPVARALPLLAAIARGETRRVVVDYLPGASLALDVEPCR